MGCSATCRSKSGENSPARRWQLGCLRSGSRRRCRLTQFAASAAMPAACASRRCAAPGARPAWRRSCGTMWRCGWVRGGLLGGAGRGGGARRPAVAGPAPVLRSRGTGHPPHLLHASLPALTRAPLASFSSSTARCFRDTATQDDEAKADSFLAWLLLRGSQVRALHVDVLEPPQVGAGQRGGRRRAGRMQGRPARACAPSAGWAGKRNTHQPASTLQRMPGMPMLRPAGAWPGDQYHGQHHSSHHARVQQPAGARHHGA